jgi:1-acyl-sn-glycerol-3-phosphate acyltransferase
MRSLWFLGTRIRVHGSIPELDAPVLIVSNHQSMFDISIYHTLFYKFLPKFVAKKELGRGIPSVSFNLRTRAGVLIDRSNPRQAIPALKDFGQRAVSNKFSVVIFPEGTRSRDGSLGELQQAGFSAVFKAMPGVPILPVAIDGSWKITARRFGPAPVGVSIDIVVGQPIYPHQDDTRQSLMKKCQEHIESALIELRT